MMQVPIIEDFSLKPINSSPSVRKNGIAICIPVSDSIPGMFLSSFARIYVSVVSRGLVASLSITDVLPLDRAREMLCNRALSEEPELRYLLWLDADMMVTERHLSELLAHMESHQEVDTVSGIYFTKSRYEPACYRKDSDGVHKRFMPPTKEPTDVDAVGMGCMLIRIRSLKEKLLRDGPKRLFWFDPLGSGEDINFCSLMKESGMRIVVLPSVVIPHYGAIVDEEDYLNYRKNQSPPL